MARYGRERALELRPLDVLAKRRSPMNTTRYFSALMVGILVLSTLLFAGYVHAQGEPIDEVHKKALKEGGVLNCYCSIAQINAEKFFPIFEKRFPGIRINHVDATADKLVARAVTEARGGKTLGDVFNTNLENVGQMHDQGLLLEKLPPEEAEYPKGLKGTFRSEARGGKTLGDVFNTNLENVGQMHDQGLLLEKLPPEEAEYPQGLKGTYW